MNSIPDYPDYSAHGYKIIKEIGRNREGGRITWLASFIETDDQVVIKQYSFAQTDSNWSSFNAHEREIEVLRGLNHPRIPRYLKAFPTLNGFCLVQEYIDAPSLAISRSFEREEVKRIAIQVLDILVYLQNRIPCIIHRDIKPENLLVDEQLNVYLIDFGFARIASQEVSGSSVFVGTPGFIPPEQLFKPTTATDLYALGVTLICLLTGTKSTKVQTLLDEDEPYQIRFRHLPKLSLGFLDWLEMMVQPKLKDRFENAQEALDALKPLDMTRCPQVEFSHQIRDFKATHLDEKIRQSITIENLIPDTSLEGRWEVAYHPRDPLHKPNSHPWISITPMNFTGNHTTCNIEVDTSQLMAGKLYKRQLFLHTNGYPKTHTLTVKVRTAVIPIQERRKSYASLIWAFLTGEIATITATKIIEIMAFYDIVFWNWSGIFFGIPDGTIGAGIFGTVGAIFGSIASPVIAIIYNLFQEKKQKLKNISPYPKPEPYLKEYGKLMRSSLFYGMLITGVLGIIIGGVYGTIVSSSRPNDLVGIIGMSIWGIISGGFFACIIGGITGGIAGSIIGFVTYFLTWAILKIVNDWLSLLATVFGISVGLVFVVGFLNQFTMLALGITGILLLYEMVYTPIKHHRLITKYRHSEKNLIKP
ncbi:MAG: serine/threonine-protein kinase [Calothrix sp. MO_192.B10]|nr:serine/threonine-protein kinase [Calothrix sp. MO_192.B10]